MRSLKNNMLALILVICNFAVYAETASEAANPSESNIFIEILVYALIFGIPLLVIIRKIRRKIRNFKEDVKSGGFGEATMSRLEDHFDRKNKK